ncbi:MAG: GT4 family glycosyltransferase PelF, partial [Lachnospiraceae bacterium]|nr:GT4 family glycosyltransferase PelF [Lachnospiraceae bacterium]
YAFTEVKEYVPKARLYILGDVDDPEYEQECHRLMEQLGVEDIIFTGVVQVKEYFPKFDFTILTSISEGQPLSVLESFAAGRPVVATDVGCCRELIEGRGDDIGPAGLVVPPMNARLLAQAMIRLCEEKSLRLTMGENGRKRAKEHYTQEMSMGSYEKLYREVVSQWQESGSN